MEPRVIASSGDEVVVLWRQWDLSPDGERFDGPLLGLNRVQDGKLARAQMFYSTRQPWWNSWRGRVGLPSSNGAGTARIW
jgi:hypothetical protein